MTRQIQFWIRFPEGLHFSNNSGHHIHQIFDPAARVIRSPGGCNTVGRSVELINTSGDRDNTRIGGHNVEHEGEILTDDSGRKGYALLFQESFSVQAIRAKSLQSEFAKILQPVSGKQNPSISHVHFFVRPRVDKLTPEANQIVLPIAESQQRGDSSGKETIIGVHETEIVSPGGKDSAVPGFRETGVWLGKSVDATMLFGELLANCLRPVGTSVINQDYFIGFFVKTLGKQGIDTSSKCPLGIIDGNDETDVRAHPFSGFGNNVTTFWWCFLAFSGGRDR